MNFPKPIDWTKYIEPLYQIFETKNGLTIAKFVNKFEYDQIMKVDRERQKFLASLNNNKNEKVY